jgi:pimeloyl-ACP methyl ester carboxylesterase
MSQSIAEWCAAGGSFEYRGHRIFTRSGGRANAPALLLIHGFPTASWDWAPIWAPLAERYRVLTLDMVGFGFSDKPRDYDYSILDQANLIEHFLVAHKIERYHVLAHDYGDTVAQELLARQADSNDRPRMGSLCFLNGGLFPESHRALPMQRLLASPLGPLVGALASRHSLATSMRAIFGKNTPPDETTLDGFWHMMCYNGGTRVLHRLISYMEERRHHRERWVGALQRATIPLRVIDGAADPVSGAHMVQRYRALVPAADTVLLEDIGHYPQIEAPEAVLKAYLAFGGVL